MLKRETERLLNQRYLSPFNPKFIPGLRNHCCFSTCYYKLYTSSMLKWKPMAPDNVLASTEFAAMLSEIIRTFGFLSSSRYLFAHQHHPCLHCCNLTDTQTSSKKRSWVFIYSLPVVMVLHYLVCLPGWSKRREGRLNALANPKVLSSFSSKSPVQMQSQQWLTILMTCSSCLAELLKCC